MFSLSLPTYINILQAWWTAYPQYNLWLNALYALLGVLESYICWLCPINTCIICVSDVAFNEAWLCPLGKSGKYSVSVRGCKAYMTSHVIQGHMKFHIYPGAWYPRANPLSHIRLHVHRWIKHTPLLAKAETERARCPSYPIIVIRFSMHTRTVDRENDVILPFKLPSKWVLIKPHIESACKCVARPSCCTALACVGNASWAGLASVSLIAPEVAKHAVPRKTSHNHNITV